MTRLVWDQNSAKNYETGVSQCVLFPTSGPGVVWNGVINVSETQLGGEANPYYLDGVKYANFLNSQAYQAKVTAFAAPKEFAICLGERSVVPGVIVARQPRVSFGFSYKTFIGDEVGYKLHLVYNAWATPTQRKYSTLTNTPSVGTLGWTIDATPPQGQPSAHIVLDSTKLDAYVMETVEARLYGSLTKAPRLPTIEELLDITGFWYPVIIIPETNTGLAELISGMGDLTRTRIPGLYRDVPDTRLIPTVINGLYSLTPLGSSLFIWVIASPDVTLLPEEAQVGDLVFSISDKTAYSFGTPPSSQVRPVIIIQGNDPSLLPENAYAGDLVFDETTSILYQLGV